MLIGVYPSHAGLAVKVEAKVLYESGYGSLQGKSAGLIMNHMAIVDAKHLAYLIHAGGKVRLAALFVL